MVKKLEQICLMLLVLVGMTSCYPPSVQYPYTEFVTNRRVQLKDNLVALLPLEQQEQFGKAMTQEQQFLKNLLVTTINIQKSLVCFSIKNTHTNQVT